MKCINVYVYRMYIGPITKTHIGLPILNQYTFACWVTAHEKSFHRNKFIFINSKKNM